MNKNNYRVNLTDKLQSHSLILPMGFLSVIILMLLISSLSIIKMKNNNALLQLLIQENNYKIKHVNIMLLASRERSLLIFQMLDTNDPFKIDELFMQFNSVATDIVLSKNAIDEGALDSAEKRILKQQGKMIRKNAQIQNHIVELIINNQKKEAKAIFLNQALPSQEELVSNLIKLFEYEYELTDKFSNTIKSKTTNTILLFIYLAIISFFSSLTIAFLVTRNRFKSEHLLSKRANYDLLTGLPNRSKFTYELNNAIKSYNESPKAVLFFDIDYFKTINDTYGHDVGDEVLKYFAQKILDNIQPKDILSRFGGDEFVLLIQSMKSWKDITRQIEKLSQHLDTSFTINGTEIFISASIGITRLSEELTTPDLILKQADLALYHVKESSRNSYEFFSDRISNKKKYEDSICHTLHSILKDFNSDNQLFLNYQPLYNIKNNNVMDYEVLIRWKTKDGNTISPEEFIPLAEQSSLIDEVNYFVIDEVCKQQLKWKQLGIEGNRLHINLSGNKISFIKLTDHLLDTLTKLELSPSLFGIELTERTLFEIDKQSINKLKVIQDLGIKISVDDFGTGYSSLSYLKKLPITALKIDQSFISGLPHNKEDKIIVNAICTLANALNLEVIAEGIENKQQLHFISNMLCSLAQGYYFNPPLSAKNATQLMLSYTPLEACT